MFVIKYGFLQINEHQVLCCKMTSPVDVLLPFCFFAVQGLSPNKRIVHINMHRTKKTELPLQQRVLLRPAWQHACV
jgi:hypothetical protein